MPQRRSQLLAVVGEDVCAARDGNGGHAVIEQVFGSQLGIDVDQYPVGGLPLAGMTRDRVAVVEVQETWGQTGRSPGFWVSGFCLLIATGTQSRLTASAQCTF